MISNVRTKRGGGEGDPDGITFEYSGMRCSYECRGGAYQIYVPGGRLVKFRDGRLAVEFREPGQTWRDEPSYRDMTPDEASLFASRPELQRLVATPPSRPRFEPVHKGDEIPE